MVCTFEPVEQRQRRLDAGLLVVVRPDSPVDERRGGRLAEVVAHGAEHQRHLLAARQIVDHRARLVDDQQRVRSRRRPRVPLGLLLAADQRVHLGEEPRHHADLEPEREADRGPARQEQQLLDLAPDPLGRQIVERDGPADRDGRVVGRQLETRGELQRAEHAQAVVGEGARIDDAQPSPDRGRRGRRTGRGSRPVSGSQAIALMVKSRRRAASSTRHPRVAGDLEPAVAAARPSTRAAAAPRRCRRPCRP